MNLHDIKPARAAYTPPRPVGDDGVLSDIIRFAAGLRARGIDPGTASYGVTPRQYYFLSGLPYPAAARHGVWYSLRGDTMSVAGVKVFLVEVE